MYFFQMINVNDCLFKASNLSTSHPTIDILTFKISSATVQKSIDLALTNFQRLNWMYFMLVTLFSSEKKNDPPPKKTKTKGDS